MGSVKEHLVAVHKKFAADDTDAAAFHSSSAEHLHKLAGHYKKTEMTEAEKDAHGAIEALAAQHEERSAQKSGMSAYHTDCAEKCSKADDGDLSKLIPTSVSAVAPNRPGITAVPRAGSPPLPVRDPNDPFVKIIGIDEESQHAPEPSLR